MNPFEFPSNPVDTFLLEGPIGHIEVTTAQPKDESISAIGVVLHPHSLFGGNWNNKVVTTTARTFNHMGLRVVRMNFRGVGRTEGRFDNGIGESQDVLVLLKWLQTVAPRDKIWLAGFSFGAYVAFRTALEWDINQLVLIAPPVNHFDFSVVKTIPVPTLIIQGDQDEVVPFQAVSSWVATLTPQPNYQVFEKGSHFFHGRLPELSQVLQSQLITNVI